MPRLLRLCRSAAIRPLERITLVVAAMSGAIASIAVAPDARGLLGAALAVVVALVAAIDARHFIIPDELTAIALALGLGAAAVSEPEPFADGLLIAVARGMMLAALFWGLRAAYGRLRGREGIGLGDVKLAGVAGVWLSWSTIPVSIEIAAAAALATALVKRSLLGHEIRAIDRLPFGLFLAPAIWLGWLVDAVPIPGAGLEMWHS